MRGAVSSNGHHPKVVLRIGMRVDEISRRIIDLLKGDGRISYARIGNSVGLSEAAARQRVQRLIDAGALRITCLVEPALLGFTRAATLGVKSKGCLETATEEISAIDGVCRLARSDGSFDILVEILARDDTELLRQVNEIRRIRGVSAVEIFLHLKTSKRSDTPQH
ncbi:MAG: Lrp/AsnC family transcriptional regulator [Trebonia sp.]